MVILADQFEVGVNEVHPGRAARVLGAAMAEDPLMRFAFAHHRRRDSTIRWLLRRCIDYGCRYGEVLSTPNAEAVAIWFGPVGTKLTIGRELSSGMALAPFKLGLKSLLRLRAYGHARTQMHDQCVREPHAYLFLLGVHPAARGRNLGAKVIVPMLERADRQRLPCYLETTNERNLNYFARFGFTPALHERMSYAGSHRLNIWSMLRKPATQSTHPASRSGLTDRN